ncbi:MAG TPA: glycosyltransferase family 4 protein [Acidimicrobiales bacterium]|nr:glycosyltransferase family 4 protein [Acidimicrobiales bacterium]
MRVAFVTPRYGPQVMGGAETGARQLAEHLVADCGVAAEVFTTCALDHVTWDDVLAPGDEMMAGVLVHRFTSAAGRDPDFYGLDTRVRVAPRDTTRDQAKRWVELNGPVTISLVEALADSGVDVAAFYPYLYYPAVAGIGKVPMPGVLHPAAHDEPALYLPIFRGTYVNADALVYHTVAERRLVQRVHPVAHLPQMVLGLGVGPDVGTGRPGGELLGLGDRPYLVSVGRVDDHKGSSMLAAFFRTYKERHPGPLALALVGPVSTKKIPPDPDIVVPGPVDEADKWDIVRSAVVSVSPSALESFSLVVLEAWSAGVPVMVNATCAPTREHCERSGGGLWFGSYREFEAALDHLLADAALRASLAARGREYVERHYHWPELITRYARFLDRVTERGRGLTGVL